MAVEITNVYPGTDLPNAAGVLVTGAASSTTTVTKATICNHTTSSATFSLWIVPSGVGATADRYLIVSNKAVPAGQTLDVGDLRAQTLKAGDTIWGVASAATALAIRINAQVVT